ncbi:MAG TPA: MFS transporter [Dermatophilaceae bacterium]|nr:MFS transporter [Dermatophilaceae bacterium]HMT90219.1 MFS transporter [Dermatophilaceae bacterium]
MSHPLARRLILGIAFSALGSGLTMPFLYVYLAQVRGIPTQTVGLLFAWMGVVSFLAAPLGGTLIDRFGPRPVMISGLLVETVTTYLIGHVASVGQALVVITAVCLGTAGLYPATTAMLTRLVPATERERVYAVQFMLMNAGFGVGGLVASVLVDTSSVASFQLLYLIDALSYLGYILVVLTLPRSAGSLESVTDAGAEVLPGGWREVLSDRAMLRFMLVCIVVVTFGYAQMEAGFAAYVTETGGVPASRLGWSFAANTVVIVLGQLVALRFIPGRSRTRVLALAASIWSVSWLVVAMTGRVEGGAAVVFAILGLGLFGVGETLWAPVAPAVVNDLAPEHLRGRYNSAQAMVWTTASVLGPATAGLLLGNGLAGVWVTATVGGTALAAALFLRLRRHLSPSADGRVAVSGTAGE